MEADGTAPRLDARVADLVAMSVVLDVVSVGAANPALISCPIRRQFGNSSDQFGKKRSPKGLEQERLAW